MKKIHYNKIDIIRAFACLCILLYHLDILKSGYLAVCTFFVLNGFFSLKVYLKREHFSIKEYYLTKLKKIYLPLIIVTFLAVGIISLIPNIAWINLKRETTSVIFCYNNYYQLISNVNYFTKNISSPFTHLWYMAIILQLELIMPFIIKNLRKIKKGKKFIPCIVFLSIAFISYIYFFICIITNNLMLAYYGTFARLFSIAFGLLLGYIHTFYYSKIVINKKYANYIFYIYLLILFILFLFTNTNPWFISISMLLTTFISIRLIDYATISVKGKIHLEKYIVTISKISYEIYLIQYPIIFIFRSINISTYLKILIIIIITLILSYIINKVLNKEYKEKKQIFIYIIIYLLTIFGFFKYVTGHDYSNEIRILENELEQNRLLMEKRQKELENNKNEATNEWNNILTEFENNEKKLEEMITNMHIVGIGDSILLGASNELYEKFPNGYFDGKVNRTEHQAIAILKELEEKNLLDDVILFNLGTNGNCSKKCKDEIMNAVGDRKVFWVNATNPDYATFNPTLEEFASKYPNVYIIDWASIAKDHPEYLAYDKVHPTSIGRKVYANSIYDAIYQVFLNEFNKQKEEKIKEHENNLKKKITFIGNDLLLGIYDNIQEIYNEANFIIKKDFNYNSLLKTINDKKNNNELFYNIVLVFDNSLKLTNNEYQELIDILNDYNIFIIDINNKVKIAKQNVKVINFYNEIDENNYMTIDKIHLNKDGNIALETIIKSNLNTIE